MKTFPCPKCGTEIEKAVEDTDIISLKATKVDAVMFGLRAGHTYKAPGTKTRRVEPCGCQFAPGEFRDLVAMARKARA